MNALDFQCVGERVCLRASAASPVSAVNCLYLSLFMHGKHII